MKGKLTALVLAMAMVFLAVTAGLAAKVLFEDKFTSLNRSLGRPTAIISAKDGKLTITPEKSKTATYLYQASILPNDMEANVTVTFIKADGTNFSGGLAFWAKDANDYYIIRIDPNGNYGVSHWAGRWFEPLPWGPSDALKKGVGAVNQVKLVTKGNQGTVSLNGKEVDSFSGQPPEGGGFIGFYVESGGVNSMGFSDLKVTEP